jgi:hypothetical protein
MERTRERPLSLEEATEPQPESVDPAYLAWKVAKIKAAIKAADEHPDRSVTLDEMRKRFGLDR